MKNHWFFFFILLLFFLTACTSKSEATPTPFPATGTRDPNEDNSQLFSVTFPELLAGPESFEGNRIQVNGRYQRPSTRVCSTTQYASPATWTLTDGELTVPMNGFDNQLRSLLPNNTTMSVSGIWRQWHGPVGCGKAAVMQTIWYLEVRDIISPNPITNVTHTPVSPFEATQIAEGGGETAPTSGAPPILTTPLPGDEAATGTAVSLQPSATSPVNATSTITIAVPILTTTPTATLISGSGDSGAGTETPEGTATPTGTSVDDGSTVTPTAASTSSSPPGNSTPNPTVAPNPSATPIPTPSAQGPLDLFDVYFGTLAANTVDVWDIESFGNGYITVTLTSPLFDTAVSLRDENGTVLVSQTSTGGIGEVDTLVFTDAEVDAIYQVYVHSATGKIGPYAITYQDDFSPAAVIRGTMIYGETVSDIGVSNNFSANEWIFYGEAGDDISITVPANDNVTILSLFDDEFADVDNTSTSDSGEAAVLDVVLPKTGLYTIDVILDDVDSLFSFAYQVVLEKNN